MTPIMLEIHIIIDDVEGIKDVSGEVAIEGEVSIASTVFQIVFLENGVPITEFRRAALLIEPQYFTITLNTST